MSGRAPIGPRTAKLLWEAMVLGYANGAWDGTPRDKRGGVDRARYPKDSEIVASVLRSAKSQKDLYPTLGRLAEKLDRLVVADPPEKS
jgi:hypothetical protein